MVDGTTSKMTAAIGPLNHDRKKKAAAKTGTKMSRSRSVSSQTASGPPIRRPSELVHTRPGGVYRRRKSARTPPNSAPQIPDINPQLPSSSAALATLRFSSRDMKAGAHPTSPFMPKEIKAPPMKMYTSVGVLSTVASETARTPKARTSDVGPVDGAAANRL